MLGADADLDDGEVGDMVVAVASALGGPPEDVEGEVRVRLGSQGLVDVGGGEPGLELVGPCLELLLEGGFGFGSGEGV